MTADPGRRLGVWDRGHRVLTVGLVLTVSMAAFEALAVATILPATVGDIGGLSLYGWAFSAFMLAEIVGIAIAGRAGDARGLAPPFAAGGALFCFGLLGAGLAPTMPALIACRVVQGLGAGAISTLAYAAVARGYADAARPRMLALLSTAWVVPGLIGPAVAAAIEAVAGWRWVFLGLVPLSTVAVALAVPALRGLGPTGETRPVAGRIATAVALAGAAAVVLYAAGRDRSVVSIALALAGTAIAVPAFQRLVPAGTLAARPGLPAAIAVMGVLSAAFFGAEVFVPLSLTEVRGRSVGFAGLALTAATMTWTVGAWVQAQLVATRSRRVLVIVGLLLVATGSAAVALVLHPAVPPALAPIAWGTAGLGMGLAYSTTTLVVLEQAPRGDEGSASASMQLANVLGTALGAGLGGAALAQMTARGGAVAGAIAITDTVAVATALVAAALALRLPGRPGPPAA